MPIIPETEPVETFSRDWQPILLPKHYRELLKEFKRQNNISSYGEAIQRLILCFRRNLDIQAELDEKTVELNEREHLLNNLERSLAAQQQMLVDREQQFRDNATVSQQAFDIISGLIEKGSSQESIEALADLIQEADLPVKQFTAELKRLPGYANYLRVLADCIEKLKAEKDGMENERLAASKALIEAGREIDMLDGMMEEKRRDIEQAVMVGRTIEAAYGQMGIMLENVVGKMLQAGMPLNGLPKAAVKALAGVILITAIQLYGDEALRLASNGPAGRVVPVPVLLSELILLLAPGPVYEQTMQRLAGEAEKTG